MNAVLTARQGQLRTRRRRKARTAWLILTPFLVYYTVFSIVPLIAVFLVSLTDWNGIGLNFGALTFHHYRNIFTGAEYLTVFLNTLVMGLIILVLNLVLGFLFGYLISRPKRGMGFFRVTWYLPVVLSIAVMSLVMNTIIDPVDGAVNVFLKKLGLAAVMWRESTFWMFFWIIFLVVWKGLGGTLILFLAGFSSIPREVLEAADLDGATGAVRMFRIVVPMMRHILVFVMVTSLMGVFGIFEPVLLVSGGDPNGTTNVVMFEIYNQAFRNFNMGLSSAVSVVVLVLTMGLSILNVRMLDMKG